MPAPGTLVDLEDPLLQAYARAWREIKAEQQAIAADPLRLARQRRLREMEARIADILAGLNEETLAWTAHVLPQSYAAGGAAGAQQAGGEFTWNQVHQQAVQQLVNRTYDDLLAATKHTEDTTKALVRTLVRDETLQKTIQGRTAVEAGQRVTKILETNGISAIRYADGTRHGLQEYGQMVVRTVSATAYNEGTLNAAHNLGVVYWECFDGPDCGWEFHEDGETANGKIVTHDDAVGHVISHPNCRRSFGARPDITTPEQAAEAGRSTTRSQDEAIRASDAARGARLDRRLAGRPTTADRLAEREAKLAEREAARRAEEEAARLSQVPDRYTGLVQDQIAGMMADHRPSLEAALVDVEPAKAAKNKAIHAWLKETNPSPIQGDIGDRLIYGGTEAAMRVDRSVKKAMAFYQDALSEDAMALYSKARASVWGDAGGRAYYEARTLKVAIGENKAQTTVHEFGHHLENEMKGVQQRARAFLQYRAGNQNLTEIYRGSGEMGWKDKFIAHYMGKTYAGQADTEIVSMGMEMMYHDPSRLLEKDPEYFWFIVGILRGKIN